MDPFIVLLFLGVLFYILFRVRVVQTGHIAVCAGIGRRFSRILKEGIHILYPMEAPLEYSWSYINQQYTKQTINGIALKLEKSQIDVAPIECETSDHQPVSVDVLLIYKIADPQKALYSAWDPLNLLYQQVIKFMRKEIIQYKKEDITRNETEINKVICAAIEKEWTPTYGLSLESCEIQNVSFDDDTIRRRRQFRDGLSPAERTGIENAHALSRQQIIASWPLK